MNKNKNDEDRLLAILVVALFGVLSLAIGMAGPTVELAFFFWFAGIGLSCVALASAFSFFAGEEKKFAKDKRAALWIWAVCLLSIAVLALGWFTLSWPTYMIIETIENVYAFPPEAESAINLIKNVIGWFLILMSLGLLLWAFVNSQRREEVTYPM